MTSRVNAVRERRRAFSLGALPFFWGRMALLAGILVADSRAAGQTTGLAAFRPGERLIYNLDYSNASLVDFASITGGTNPSTPGKGATSPTPTQAFKTSIKGSLFVTVLKSTATETLLVCSLQGSDLEITYNEAKANADVMRVSAALGRDFYAVVNPQGKVVRVEFAPGTDGISQSFARTLLAAIQFVTPPEAPVAAASWEVEEEDSNGTYLAHYERQKSIGEVKTAPGSQQVLTKKKMKYLPRTTSTHSRVVTVPVTIVPEGESLIHRNAETGRLVSLRGAEHQVISASGRTLADSKSELTVILNSNSTLSEAEMRAISEARERLSSELIATSLFETKRDKAAEARYWKEILGNANWESLRESLAGADSMAHQSKAELAEKLEALCRLRPESCGELGAILETASYRGDSFRMVMIALSRAGNAEAQLALIKGLQARRDEAPAMFLLIGVLPMLERPTRETEVALRELAFGDGNSRITQSAQLALGTLTQSLVETDPDRASDIVSEIARRLESTSSLSGKERLLGALGNAGTREALNVIRQHLAGSNVDLRAAALSVLVRVNPSQANEILAQHLLDDADEAVRLAAAREISSRKTTAATFDAQKRAFQKDEAESVRAMLLSGLWEAKTDFPEAESIIKKASKMDKSKEVQQMARNLVENRSR